MSETILERQDIKNMEAAQNEPDTLEQLKKELGEAYVAAYIALDNYTLNPTRENDDKHDELFSALCTKERQLSRRLYDLRKNARESVKFEKDPADAYAELADLNTCVDHNDDPTMDPNNFIDDKEDTGRSDEQLEREQNPQL